LQLSLQLLRQPLVIIVEERNPPAASLPNRVVASIRHTMDRFKREYAQQGVFQIRKRVHRCRLYSINYHDDF
jgi:hypothetical protein